MTMSRVPFYDEASLSETAAKLGQKAIRAGLIPSFVVRYYPDSCQFFIPDERQSEPLTPEQAYMRLKRSLEQVSLGNSS
jgi:hypothetical protein